MEVLFPHPCIPRVVPSTRGTAPLEGEAWLCLPIGQFFPEMQMKLLGSGRELAESEVGVGLGPGPLQGPERGGGKSITDWDPDSQNKH